MCAHIAVTHRDQGNVERKWHLEVEGDKRKDEALEILHKVVEDPETLGVLAALHVEQRTDL
jgi:hypothetical protein